MDTMKGQGAQAEEITLSALLKMLELSKFLTVETMCEQYLSSHPEEGMAHLVMYAAKVKSATLHKFQKGIKQLTMLDIKWKCFPNIAIEAIAFLEFM